MIMEQRVTLSFGNGTLAQGFPTVTAKLRTLDPVQTEQVVGALPPAPQLNELYQQWRTVYRQLTRRQGLRTGADESVRPTEIEGFAIASSGINRVSDRHLHQLSQQLTTALNQWLQTLDFRPIDQKLRSFLQREADIQVLLETSKPQDLLRRLPWHDWDLSLEFPQMGLALSPSQYRQQPTPPPRPQVRILGIVGDTHQIDIHTEQHFLEALEQTETLFLSEPSRQVLDAALWDDQGWDILFFAGHSYTTDSQGVLQINRQPGHHQLSLQELDYALQTAIQRGLQLAIFNSCDGLGLAQALGHHAIPAVIVMREPVPNQVAQAFFRFFLTAFVHRHLPIHLAMREAQRKLQGLEHDCPGASWLPVLWQHPGVEPLRWQHLQAPAVFPPAPSTVSKSAPKSLPKSSEPPPLPRRGSVAKVGGLSMVITVLIVLLRALGLLEPWELQTYDWLLRSRPPEGPDPRLLLIQITEQDIANQPAADRGGASLSDRALDQVVAKLEQSDATAIGIDIYRDNPVRATFPALAKRLEQRDRMFGICHFGTPGVPAAPELRPTQRHGFNNILLDRDQVLRRQLLAVESPQPCNTPYAFALQLAAQHIFDRNGVRLTSRSPTSHNLQLGETELPGLASGAGGYHALDARGHQLLVNYRTTPQIAETVTLTDFLENYDPQQVRDRIVLIGTVAPTFNDHRWYTPMGQLTGIEVQGHLISQLLSTQMN